jgi:hypothetical protein
MGLSLCRRCSATASATARDRTQPSRQRRKVSTQLLTRTSSVWVDDDTRASMHVADRAKTLGLRAPATNDIAAPTTTRQQRNTHTTTHLDATASRNAGGSVNAPWSSAVKSARTCVAASACDDVSRASMYNHLSCLA